MEDINLKAFEKKSFYPDFSQLLKGFITDFEKVLGKYVSQDELIKRINENVDSIAYKELEYGVTGNYNRREKSVGLSNKFLDANGKRYFKTATKESTFFHEIGGHAIRASGFVDLYTIEDFDEDYNMKKEEILLGYGIEEAFSQYLTR